MRVANQTLFAKLGLEAQRSGRDLPDLDSTRYVCTTDVDKEWLKHARLLSVIAIHSQLRVAHLEFNDKRYVIVVGHLNYSDTQDELFTHCEVNAGLATLILSEVDIPFAEQASNQIIEHILPNHSGIVGYKGHDYADVLPLFEPMRMFHADNIAQEVLEDYSRTTAVLVLEKRIGVLLPFSPETYESLTLLLIDPDLKVFCGDLMESIVSGQWRHLVLDLYRLVEHLYSLPWISELKVELKLESSCASLAHHLEQYLGWRPRESECIERLFRDLPSSLTIMLPKIWTGR